MKFGMSEQQFKLLEQIVIDPLKSQGAKVFIFGSRTTGKHHSHSDLDLLYRLENNSLPPGFLSDLKEAIEQSKFPFTVDLVDDHTLAKS